MNPKECQYYHNQIERISAFVRMPDKKDLLNAIASSIKLEEKHIEIECGITFVHPKDQFCYKTGREEAKKRAEKRKFVVHSINFITEDRYTVLLFSEGKHEQFDFRITIEIDKKRKTPYFIDIV
jgi:hypothetical protein